MLNPEIYSTSFFHRVQFFVRRAARVDFTIFRALISLALFFSFYRSFSRSLFTRALFCTLFILASLMFIFIHIINSGYSQWLCWTKERKNGSSQMKEDRLKVYLDIFLLQRQHLIECGGVLCCVLKGCKTRIEKNAIFSVLQQKKWKERARAAEKGIVNLF